MDLHALSLKFGHRPPTAVEIAQHPDLVMQAMPVALPRDLIPLRRRKPGMRRLGLVLRYARIAGYRGVQSSREQPWQHSLGEIPDVLTGDIVRDRQIVHLGQYGADVNPLSHAMHGDAHEPVTVADRPQNRRGSAVLRQC